MAWNVHIQLTGPLTEEQAAKITEHDLITSIHWREGEPATVVARLDVDEDSPQAPMQAASLAAGTFRRMSYLGTLIGRGEVTVERITVESPLARSRTAKVLGTAEIAAMLGVSAGRVAQLKSRPDWPKPAVSLEVGELYFAEDIRRFNEGWDRKPGRPRKTAAG